MKFSGMHNKKQENGDPIMCKSAAAQRLPGYGPWITCKGCGVCNL
jgi:hypothetical protein